MKSLNKMSWQIFTILFYLISGIESFTEEQLEIIKSISEELVKKQIIIVENLSKETNYGNLVKTVKYFSNFQIYISFKSTVEMYSALMEMVGYGFPTYKYRPRTIVIVDEDHLPEMANKYFNVEYDLTVAKLTWISFANSQEEFMGKINGSYIPYNCQFLLINPSGPSNYEISEYYKINGFVKDFSVTNFGTWNKTNDLTVPMKDFYARRFDFNGTVLGTQNACYLDENKNLFCTYSELNLIGEIIETASRMMNFRFVAILPDNEKSFQHFRNNYPNSMLEFFNDRVYILTSEFYHVYRIPLWTSKAYLHMSYRKQYEGGMKSPFIQPFEFKLWCSTCGWILASTLILLFINYFSYRNNKSLKFFEFIDTCFVTFESFTSQCGSGISPEAASSRMAIFLTQIPPIFLVLAYSCVITSFVTARIIRLPFNSLEEFIKDGTFKFGWPQDSYTKNFFEETNDPISQFAYKKFAIRDTEMPYFELEGVNKMCDDPKFSYINFDETLFEFQYRCQPLQAPVPIFSTYICLTFRLYTSIVKVFSRVVNSFRSSGTINALRKRVYYIDNSTGKLAKNTKDFLRTRRFEMDTVDWDTVESIFILIGIIYLISVIILLIECYIFQKLSKEIKNRRRQPVTESSADKVTIIDLI